MHDAKIQDAFEELPVSSERTFPPTPFPQYHIHCVINDLPDAVQAVYALREAGFAPQAIHLMSCRDYIAAVQQKYRQQSWPVRIFRRFLALLDEGFEHGYLKEAYQGHHILAVRLTHAGQAEQVRDLLISHSAHLIKYVATWTVAYLSPTPEHFQPAPHQPVSPYCRGVGLPRPEKRE
jgi:hypothetical protein